MKTIFDLELHEELLIKDEDYEKIVVMRVPGGYLYKHYEPVEFTIDNNNLICTTQTFVPYSHNSGQLNS